MLYDRLDVIREQAAERLSGLLRESVGTPQARFQRDATVARYAERVAQYNAVEHGLCFGRLDFRDGGSLHIGHRRIQRRERRLRAAAAGLASPGRPAVLRRHRRLPGWSLAPPAHPHPRPYHRRPRRRGARPRPGGRDRHPGARGLSIPRSTASMTFSPVPPLPPLGPSWAAATRTARVIRRTARRRAGERRIAAKRPAHRLVVC